jgi:site-specific DNA recombinase
MENSQARLRLALYVRVSSDEQREGHTIDSQIAELRHFADQKEWPVISVYADEAWSGAILARPKLDQLRDDAHRGAFDAVLINDVDRLARDVTHLGIIKRDLERSGVRVIFRKIPSESSPTNNLLVNMLGSFAEFEREMILDRTRRGRLHKVETRQQFIGAIAAFGYRYTPGNQTNPSGKLSINPQEAATVRQMFTLVDREGLSARDVALRLTRDGLPTRKGGKVWQRSSVLRVLRGTIYTGTWYYNKHKFYPKDPQFARSALPEKKSLRQRPRGEWIPVALPKELAIISLSQWERVQRQLDRNRAFSRRNSKHEYLLSSLARCGGCQGPLCGNPSRGRFSYRCIRRCKRVPEVSESTLDNAVWQALEAALRNPKLLVGAIRRIDERVTSGNDHDQQIEAALDGIKQEEKRILEAYRQSIITPEQLAGELAALEGRRKMLGKEQARESSSGVKQKIQSGIKEVCAELCDRLANLTFETKRSVLRLLVKQILFSGDQVKISGMIPFDWEDGIAATTSQANERNPAGGGGIVTTTSRAYERNSPGDRGIVTTTPACCERSSTFSANFVLSAPVEKMYAAAAREASRQNLIKANAALKKMRHRNLSR